MNWARARPSFAMTESSESTQSSVSFGSRSGSWRLKSPNWSNISPRSLGANCDFSERRTDLDVSAATWLECELTRSYPERHGETKSDRRGSEGKVGGSGAANKARRPLCQGYKSRRRDCTRAALGIDVGGTGVKTALVDVTTGELLSHRHRVNTPRPSTPEAVARRSSRSSAWSLRNASCRRICPSASASPASSRTAW